MDTKIENRLTAKERKLIESIETKAMRRKHKKHYDVKFIVTHMLESFKDWSYDEKADAYDMLDAILEVAKKCKVLTPKQLASERRYVTKEYINTRFEDET